MDKHKTAIDEKATILGEEIKKQFAKAGDDAKQQLLDSFKNILENDINNLKMIANKAVSEHSAAMKSNLQNTLNQTIKQQFGGSVFGGILQDLILPTIFQGVSTGKVDINSQSFREAASQTLLDIGKSIDRSNSRNG